jgi:16S rRNA C967 or C1407 C5-methylase (RsmB/RsmF family)
LEENKDFEYVDFSVGNISSQNGMYTFFPHINGTDGFFIAKLRRVR